MLWSAVHGSGAASMDVGRGRERVTRLQNSKYQTQIHKYTNTQNIKRQSYIIMNADRGMERVQSIAKLVNGIYINGCANI